MKRLALVSILAAGAVVGVAPSVAGASGVSPARISPEPTRPLWKPELVTSPVWKYELVTSPVWRFEISKSPVTRIAPVHLLQWKAARHLGLGSRLVLQTAR